MRQKHKFENAVSETLLIPLYMRAKESRRGKNAILMDNMAEQLAESIDYDYSKLDGARLSEVGCVVRGWYFDSAVRRFINNHKHPVVVNVGCGLDTRCQRIGDDGNTVYYELDLPEVIALRQQLIPEPANGHYLQESLLDTGWMDRLRQAHPDGDFIFIAEGVLMYFYESQVRTFLRNIASRFSKGELWFDMCGTMTTRKGVRPDSLKDAKAQIRSGIDNARIVETWEPRLQLIEQANYMSFFRDRWGFMFGHLLGHMTWLCRKFSSLAGFRIL